MTDEPGFNLFLRWPNDRVEVYRVANAEPVPTAPFNAVSTWGVELATGLLVVNAQRVRMAGGQLTGISGEPVLLGAPLSALTSWAVEPA
jgi:hypothetical protein